MAASLAVGELAALLKTRRDEAAAAAQEAEPQTSAGSSRAKIPLNIFAVAEHGDFKIRFRWSRRYFIQDTGDLGKSVDRVGVPALAPVVCLCVASASAR